MEYNFEAGYKPVRRNGPQISRSSSVVVFFETVEDFDEQEEVSWISSITDEIRESGKSVDELNLLGPAIALLDLLEIERSVEMGLLALAWVRDTLDPKVDDDQYGSKNLFPRLSAAAKEAPKKFQVFQQAMNNNKIACQGIPQF